MTHPTPQPENSETRFERGETVFFDRYGDGEKLISATFNHPMPGMSTAEKTVVSVDPDDRETDYEFVAARALSHPEDVAECSTCERTVLQRYMSGRECLSCEHVRADAREARRDAEREARPVDGRRP